MSKQSKEMEHQRKIVLVVPVQHVKTVKTALEQSGQLDRASKITTETQEIGQTEDVRRGSSNSDVMGSNSSHGHASDLAPFPEQPSDSSGTSQFPALHFDPASGEYRGATNLPSSSGLQFDVNTGQYRQPTEQPRFPHIGFDPASGEYKKPAESTEFPKLQFDPNTGEYRDPSEIKQHPALEFNVGSGQYEKPAEKPRLHFDLGSGEYRQRSTQEQRMRIPTTISHEIVKSNVKEQEPKAGILERLGLDHLSQVISLSHSSPSDEARPISARHPLHKALQTALEDIQATLLEPIGLTVESLLSHFPDSYLIYTPMLLLSHNAFASPPWQKLLSSHPLDSNTLQPLWKHIASAVNTTHMAINSPIPAQTSSTPSQSQSNILRSPLNITPIFGDFGPAPSPTSLSSPIPTDFAAAFWVTTTQNGIQQTWAPLYTMFSRGNVKEKARILNLPSVSPAPATTAVAVADLYAGIGYFAFSYKKVGMQTILGWELNPWSVEGLRRGAGLNGWSIRVITGDDLLAFEKEEGVVEEDFLVFQLSNETASSIIAGLKLGNKLKGAITHVNLGLLPTSTLSWGTAVSVLKEGCEGWIHAHENVAVGDIEARTKEIEEEFQRLVGELGDKGTGRKVSVEHVERVKMYAPGVAHCVFDVRVSQAK